MTAIKLMMTWDILPGREEDYFEFHIQKFVPSLEKMGVTLNEAWLTVYGEAPRLTAEALIADLRSAKRVLGSNEWEDLGTQLHDFVENFSFKLVPARTRFQL